MKYYLAIDIGASSGRHIVGWEENGELKTEEVFRFPNGMEEKDGHLIWDVARLEQSVRDGIDAALDRYPQIVSLSIDTWGVDYVLMKGETPVLPCYAYRDSRTSASIPEVHRRVPFAELYRHTGIQFQTFNTVYQLYADLMAGRLEGADDFLMMPEYLLNRLCGAHAHEYTNATTGGLVAAATGQYDSELIMKLGLPGHLFKTLSAPGTAIGEYKGITCRLCATHDTGSAVEGIPMPDDAAYISSGTWSLLGVRSRTPHTDEASQAANWSNEGGVGYIRFQKNIMGMWLINELRAELCPDKPFPEIVAEAQAAGFDETVDANDERFFAPESMKAAFDSALSGHPASVGDYFRCAYRSLAGSYRTAIEELERLSGASYGSIYIVGGGAKNTYLNELTEQATGRRVVALPIEATALGNLRIQMKAE